MSGTVNDGAGPTAPADGATEKPEAPGASGIVARAGSSPGLEDLADGQNPSGRRLRSKAPVKIPDDDVPAPPPRAATSSSPNVDYGPLAMAPMRIISLGTEAAPVSTPTPAAAPDAPPVQAKSPSKIPPAPGTQTESDPGWTPGPPAAIPATFEPRKRIATPDLEELSVEDLSPDSEEQTEPPPAPSVPQSRQEGVSHSVPASPPPRPPAVTRPDGVAASQPPRAMSQTRAADDLALPPPRGPMASSPSDVITSARPTTPSRPPVDLPPPRGPMASRPPLEGGSLPPLPPPMRPPSISHSEVVAEASSVELRDSDVDIVPIPPRERTTSEDALDIQELPDAPRTMEVEEIYVSLGDTNTEEPPGLASADVRTPPPPPPHKISSPPPPVAEAKPTPPAVPPGKHADTPPVSQEKPSKRESKKRVRPWWEEMFDDDFLRSLERPSDRLVIAESLFIEERLGLQKGAVVLDLACGAGRHAVELTRRGYKVVGYDLSLAMLARAQDEASEADQNINFLHGDMREMAFESMFDGVYCWGMSFGFFEEEKNVNVVQRIHKALRPGGVFLLDVCNRDFIAPRQPNLVWFEGEGCICMDETNLDFITSRLKVKRTVMIEEGRTRELDYSIRLYGLHELGKILHDCGFKVLEVSGQIATPGVFFGSESPRCLVLAERG